jgi:hypothetical protein
MRNISFVPSVLHFSSQTFENALCPDPGQDGCPSVPGALRPAQAELDNQCFHRYNKQTRVFDKFLDVWALYCDGTREDAADMILFYMAKHFPQLYVKNFKSDHKDDEPSCVEFPPDFISYNGTSNIKWNTKSTNSSR